MSYGDNDRVRTLFYNINITEVSDDLLDACRVSADNDINGKLLSTYPSKIPFTTVPALINSISDDLTIYYICRSKFRGVAPLSAGIITEYYDKPIAKLQEIAERKIEFSEFGHKTEVISTTEDYSPVFELDNETKWKVSESRLDDVEDERDE